VIVPVAPAIADSTGAGPATIGLLVASFPTGMVVGFALAGGAVRRHGSRRLLVASLMLVAIGALGFVLGDSLGVYFAARALMGLGSGGIWIGVTFDTLERWPGQEYVCMSRVFAAYAAGGLVGPALGAFGGVHGPFLAYLVLVALRFRSYSWSTRRSRGVSSRRTAEHFAHARSGWQRRRCCSPRSRSGSSRECFPCISRSG
jgi:MFS family permease